MKKIYSIECSPLYKLNNKNQLAELLYTELKFIQEIRSSRQYYKIWEEPKDSGHEIRVIETPCKKLKRIQGRLLQLLSRIDTPDYLKSGKKGEDYISNARYHKESSSNCLCIDINKFYPSVSKEYVFRAFKNDFQMSEDLAGLITEIVTIKKNESENEACVPTGAPTSQLIAFLAYQKTFTKLYDFAKLQEISMSLYVDDITFSSNQPISQHFFNWVEKRLKEVGLRIKSKKTKRWHEKDHKSVTGVILTPSGELKISNKQKKKIREKMSENPSDPKKLASLLGSLNSAQRIEPNFMKSKKEDIIDKLRKIEEKV